MYRELRIHLVLLECSVPPDLVELLLDLYFSTDLNSVVFASTLLWVAVFTVQPIDIPLLAISKFILELLVEKAIEIWLILLQELFVLLVY